MTAPASSRSRGPLTRRLSRRLYLWDRGRRLRQRLELRLWEARGRPSTPPPRFKQRLVAAYAERFATEILVETGTYLGDMVFAVRGLFETVYSIELDPWLYRRACKRFRKDRHVHLLPGDSCHMLPFVLSRIARPTLFWLDAHQIAGGVRGVEETPVARELEEILRRDLGGCVLLIDDARLFTGSPYPTIAEVRKRILERHPRWVFQVEDDVIRAHARDDRREAGPIRSGVTAGGPGGGTSSRWRAWARRPWHGPAR